MGASVPPTVTDEELDQHVAELILKEAKTKATNYSKGCMRAYIPKPGYTDSNAPRTNKSFLNSLVKNANMHNKVVLQTQADAAEQVKEVYKSKDYFHMASRAQNRILFERSRHG
ncbi:hypothetical protein RhiXN_09770 [Rhizoctonia solani]|uniref:Uncharacterized protein n=1 Tax=Rhizoctonia solani TaxID=456999 RepID=A0A8H8SZA1_9AGAM|nr:uncharacterized protein RhiXN_09770 [Rhizoctonia solani]QRW22183.1 hypothetical protein RhiXN_09770 [Rhizoctonia solani]